MDEQRAIRLCLKHRDPVGFEFLVRKYRREAYFHAFNLLQSQEDALDACQDAFARAFAALPRLESLTQFYPWFYRILRNHCLNLLARRQTSARWQSSAACNHGAFLATASPGDEPRSVLEHAEDARAVRDALGQLRPDFREILTMKYLQSLSYDEIAGLLQIPRGTVMSRLYHARIALRQALQDDHATPTTPQDVT